MTNAETTHEGLRIRFPASRKPYTTDYDYEDRSDLEEDDEDDTSYDEPAVAPRVATENLSLTESRTRRTANPRTSLLSQTSTCYSQNRSVRRVKHRPLTLVRSSLSMMSLSSRKSLFRRLDPCAEDTVPQISGFTPLLVHGRGRARPVGTHEKTQSSRSRGRI